MSTLAVVFVEFFVCVGLIGVAGSRMSRYADVLAEKTGLGKTWIGMMLLGVVTSLPELVTGVSAVALAGQPDIAVGDALGSCVFNLVLFSLLDLLHRDGSVYAQAGRSHLLSAGFGIVAIGLAGLAIAVGGLPQWSIGHVGLYTPALLLLYVAAVRSVYRRELRHHRHRDASDHLRYPSLSVRAAVVRYAAAAVVVVAAGTWLPYVGERIAVITGWGNSFVGTLLVAFATSVPELVVTVAALRLKAIDMAVGNLLGSNLFDMAILAIDDLAYRAGPILADVEPVHAVSALSAVTMSGVVATAIGLSRAAPSRRAAGWMSAVLVAIYLVNSYALFPHRG